MKFAIAALALASVKACPDPFVGDGKPYTDDKCTKDKTDVDEAGKKAFLAELNKAMAAGFKGGACQTEGDVNWKWNCDDKGAKVAFYKTKECKETTEAPKAATDQMAKDGILQAYLYDTCYPVDDSGAFFAKYSAPAAKGGDDDKDGDDKEGDDKEAGAKTMAVSMMAALAIAASQF